MQKVILLCGNEHLGKVVTKEFKNNIVRLSASVIAGQVFFDSQTITNKLLILQQRLLFVIGLVSSPGIPIVVYDWNYGPIDFLKQSIEDIVSINISGTTKEQASDILLSSL